VTEEDKIWTAGFFDGRGGIYIIEMTDVRMRSGFRHRIRIELCSKDFKIPHWLQATYGGSVSFDKKGNYTWVVASENAKLFLLDIYLYTRFRKEEIGVALKFCRTYDKKGDEVSLQILGTRRKLLNKLRTLQGKEPLRRFSLAKRPGYQKWDLNWQTENDKEYVGYFDSREQALKAVEAKQISG
jgi:hypothetical protein